MSRELAKMNLISVVQQLPKEDIETIQGYVEMIEEENQSLKKQLEDLQETYYLIQGGRSNGKTYLMKLQADKEQLNSLVNSCQEEIRRLKKQLEEYKKLYKDELEENSKLSELWCDSRAKIRELENQQNEFIDYLSSYIELLNNKPDLIEEGQKDILKEVFDKFKEIKES